MSATVELSESNGAGETVTDGISNINWGSADLPDLVAADHKIIKGRRSFDKYIRFHLVDLDTSNQINNIRIWKSAGSYVAGESIIVNLATTELLYLDVVYAQPTSVAWGNSMTLPSADPGVANLKIADDLAGALTAPGYSEYWRSQLVTTSLTPTGLTNAKTIKITYDET